MLIRRVPWTRQPQGPTRINWVHPLANGLAFLSPLRPVGGLGDLVAGALPTITGGVVAELNNRGQFASFASGRYLDFQAPAAIGPTTPATIAWTQEPRNTVSNSTILHLQTGTAGSTKAFLIYQSTTGTYNFTAGPSSGTAHANSWSAAAGAPTNNRRDAFVLSSAGGLTSTTGTDWTLYRNGILLARGTNTSFTNVTSAGFRVGALLSGGDPWEGLIGDLHMWARVLTEQEAVSWSANVNQLFEPRSLYIPTAEAATGPTVLAVTPTTIGSTSHRPRYTWTPA
jgi:hypothetical protein